MVNMGTKHVKSLPDHWTQATHDGKPSAHFEHTIAITADGPWVLTGAADSRAKTSTTRRCPRAVGSARPQAGENVTIRPDGFRAIWPHGLYSALRTEARCQSQSVFRP